MSIEEIEVIAKAYAEAYDALRLEVRALEAAVVLLKARRLPKIRQYAAAAANAKAELEAAVDAGRPLFKRPKTRILHGIKVGLQKGKGKISFDDAAAVIKRIRAKLPRKAKALIKVTETPVKAALGQLSADELKKIGVTVHDAEDQVVAAPTDSDIDKLVDALLSASGDGAGA